MESMMKMTIEEFTNELASNSPAPGGGSVAALSSSLGASLASMVFSLTVGKKIYNEYDDEKKKLIDDSLAEAKILKDRFLNLIDEDTKEFNKLMAAFKLPKATDEEKAIRSQKIQEGYKGATEVPLTTARETMKIFDLLKVASEFGNPNAVSDAGVGAMIAMTGLEGAVMNVKINLSSIKDKNFVNRVSDECEMLVKKANEKKEVILKEVNSKL